MTLTEFLAARIAGDEAKIAYMRDEIHRVKTAPAYAGYRDAFLASLTGIRLFLDPDRWAAECAAKRQLLAFIEDATGDMMCQRGCWWDIARIMARTWAEHPDYDQGWAL